MHHVTALVKLSEHIPRRHTHGGVKSGYTPHHKFPNVSGLLSGAHDYLDEEYHFFGEELIARIAFPCWDDFRDLIRVGDTFEVRELKTLVGTGEILSIDR